MYSKLIVAGIAVISLTALGHVFLNARYRMPRVDTVKSITLLPETLGASPMLKSWHNDQAGSIVEIGALYAAGTFGAAPVIVDYRSGSPRAHNGIGCFLTRGYNLVFERLRKLRTAAGVVVFDVGAVRAGDRIKLIAAAACTPEGCEGQRLPFAESLSEKLSWDNFIRDPYANGVVPVAVILEQKIGPRGVDATLADMNAQLQRVMQVINLTPARRLAAAQSR